MISSPNLTCTLRIGSGKQTHYRNFRIIDPGFFACCLPLSNSGKDGLLRFIHWLAEDRFGRSRLFASRAGMMRMFSSSSLVSSTRYTGTTSSTAPRADPMACHRCSPSAMRSLRKSVRGSLKTRAAVSNARPSCFRWLIRFFRITRRGLRTGSTPLHALCLIRLRAHREPVPWIAASDP